MATRTEEARPSPAIATWGRLRRLRGDKSGTSAVEFAIVAAPFFALLFALVEIGLVFFANFTLENAVDRASRMIRTGQAQQQVFDADKFKQEVCGHVHALLSCADGLKVDVRTFDSFGSITLPPPLDEDGNMVDEFTYEPGNGGKIVVVRAFYEWGLLANIPGIGLGNMASGARLISGTAAFRNEPFDN